IEQQVRTARTGIPRLQQVFAKRHQGDAFGRARGCQPGSDRIDDMELELAAHRSRNVFRSQLGKRGGKLIDRAHGPPPSPGCDQRSSWPESPTATMAEAIDAPSRSETPARSDSTSPGINTSPSPTDSSSASPIETASGMATGCGVPTALAMASAR